MKINLYLEKDALINIFWWSYIKILLLYLAMNLHETFWNFVGFSVLTIPLLLSLSEKLYQVQNFWRKQIPKNKSTIVQATSFQKI